MAFRICRSFNGQSMILILHRHEQPCFDPVWFCDSQYYMIAIWGSAAYVAGILIATAFPHWQSELKYMIPAIIIATAIIIWLLRRVRVANLNASARSAWKQKKFPSLADAADSDRFVCIGEAVELEYTLSQVDSAPLAHTARLLFNRYILLLCYSCVVLGWPLHAFFDVPRPVVNAAYLAVGGAIVIWPLLFALQYELYQGVLRIIPLGIISRWHDVSRGTPLDKVNIRCDYRSGTVDVWNDAGQGVRIRLDGISRRHLFVSSLLRNAGWSQAKASTGEIRVCYGDKQELRSGIVQ